MPSLWRIQEGPWILQDILSRVVTAHRIAHCQTDFSIDILTSMTTEIFTIGHSNHTWESFAPLLADNEIELLVDTRTRPVSRFAPFANHRTLPDLLEGAGIDYEFMGGPRWEASRRIPAMYDSAGKPDYHKMRSPDEFQEAISQLVGMASRRRTAILCSEEDPSQCHRLLLLGPSLEENGCRLLHIRKYGQVQGTGRLSLGNRYRKQIQGALDLTE